MFGLTKGQISQLVAIGIAAGTAILAVFGVNVTLINLV